jgi:hypothetical protein
MTEVAMNPNSDSTPEAHDIFIAYRRELGTHFAERAYRMLLEHGFRVYMDVHGYSPGPFPKRLEEKIRASQLVLVVLSPYCFANRPAGAEEDWLVREILLARESGKHIVVLRDENCAYRDMPQSLSFLAELEDVQYVSAYPSAYEQKLLNMLGAARVLPHAEGDGADSGRSNGTHGAGLHAELLRLRDSAPFASERLGGAILATAGLYLPFGCRRFLMSLRTALARSGFPREELPAFPTMAFCVSTALGTLGTVTMLYSASALMELWPWPCPAWIAASSVRTLLLPPAVACCLGTLGFIRWFWADLANLHPVVWRCAKRAELDDIDLRRETVRWRHSRFFGASVVATAAAMFVLIMLMEEFTVALRTPGASIFHIIACLATILVEFWCLDLVIVDSVKDALVEILWPGDNRLTLMRDFFATPPRRSPAHWCNMHFQVSALTLVFLIAVATGVFKIIRLLQ